MVKEIIWFLIMLFGLPAAVKEEPTVFIGPTLAEYNNQRYLDYFGPEVELIYYEEEEPVITEVLEPEIEFTEADIDLMARVVMSEASLLSIEAKEAVAQTIINRVHSDKFPDTVSGVVYQVNQYSTADNGKPNDDCYEAIYAAIEYEPFPADMYYFRMSHYHNFGYSYMHIDNMYFSTEAAN